MKGADEYAYLFETGQYGKLYFVSYHHARGRTFQIFVLPEGEDAIPNGPGNAPLNQNAVEVYGITSGQPGWTETYGWLHNGPWINDFANLVAKKRQEIEQRNNKNRQIASQEAKAKAQRIKELLAKY
jgi:hypothetical protein